MSRVVTVTLDQFYRPQPGGIATYVRGLLQGLADLDDHTTSVVGVAPRGTPSDEVRNLAIPVHESRFSVGLLTRAWGHWPLGVAGTSDVVHATSLAGPYAGGRNGAVHSVAVHDLLWRDEPGASTSRGVRFHESRLQKLKRREDVRVVLSAPGLVSRLVDEGFARERLFEVRLGVDQSDGPIASSEVVRRHLAAHGVAGPFTLCVGTREPRKNLARLVAAQRAASQMAPDLGPLVVVGPTGWGDVDVRDAVVLGLVDRALLRGLYRDAAVFAYVPIAEGWGLPPVEALSLGARVLASSTTPSVAKNDEVVIVDPLDLEAVTDGFLRVLRLEDDDIARARRRATVAELTWRNCALDHLASWQ